MAAAAPAAPRRGRGRGMKRKDEAQGLAPCDIFNETDCQECRQAPYNRRNRCTKICEATGRQCNRPGRLWDAPGIDPSVRTCWQHRRRAVSLTNPGDLLGAMGQYLNERDQAAVTQLNRQFRRLQLASVRADVQWRDETNWASQNRLTDDRHFAAYFDSYPPHPDGRPRALLWARFRGLCHRYLQQQTESKEAHQVRLLDTSGTYCSATAHFGQAPQNQFFLALELPENDAEANNLNLTRITVEGHRLEYDSNTRTWSPAHALAQLGRVIQKDDTICCAKKMRFAKVDAYQFNASTGVVELRPLQLRALWILRGGMDPFLRLELDPPSRSPELKDCDRSGSRFQPEDDREVILMCLLDHLEDRMRQNGCDFPKLEAHHGGTHDLYHGTKRKITSHNWFDDE